MTPDIIPGLLEWEQNDLPYGSEIRAVVERTTQDGAKVLMHQFSKKIDTGSHYFVISHLSPGAGEVQTFVLSGAKGEIVDEHWRNDKIQITFLKPDGTVARLAEQEQKVRILEPGDERNMDLIREVLASKLSCSIKPHA